MNSIVELKLCPFCDGEPNVIFIGNPLTKSQKIQIKCTGCRVTRTDAILNGRGHDIHWLEAVAIKNWNQRPRTDEDKS